MCVCISNESAGWVIYLFRDSLGPMSTVDVLFLCVVVARVSWSWSKHKQQQQEGERSIKEDEIAAMSNGFQSLDDHFWNVNGEYLFLIIFLCNF